MSMNFTLTFIGYALNFDVFSLWAYKCNSCMFECSKIICDITYVYRSINHNIVNVWPCSNNMITWTLANDGIYPCFVNDKTKYHVLTSVIFRLQPHG